MWLNYILNSSLDSSIQYKTLNGRKYLVAPVTLLVTGVLPGSQGPGLYPDVENKKSVPLWEGIPLTLNHPVEQGRPTSGKLKHVFERVGLGYLRNVQYLNPSSSPENSRVRGEAWFDAEYTQNKAPQVYKNLIANQPIEVSTGLGLSKAPALPRAAFKGRAYDWIATNYAPDHLAILPNEKGACSLKDGCGVFNSNLTQESTMNELIITNTWDEFFVENCKETGKPGPCKGFKKKGVATPAQPVKAPKVAKQSPTMKTKTPKKSKGNPNKEAILADYEKTKVKLDGLKKDFKKMGAYGAKEESKTPSTGTPKVTGPIAKGIADKAKNPGPDYSKMSIKIDKKSGKFIDKNTGKEVIVPQDPPKTGIKGPVAKAVKAQSEAHKAKMVAEWTKKNPQAAAKKDEPQGAKSNETVKPKEQKKSALQDLKETFANDPLMKKLKGLFSSGAKKVKKAISSDLQTEPGPMGNPFKLKDTSITGTILKLFKG